MREAKNDAVEGSLPALRLQMATEGVSIRLRISAVLRKTQVTAS